MFDMLDNIASGIYKKLKEKNLNVFKYYSTVKDERIVIITKDMQKDIIIQCNIWINIFVPMLNNQPDNIKINNNINKIEAALKESLTLPGGFVLEVKPLSCSQPLINNENQSETQSIMRYRVTANKKE